MLPRPLAPQVPLLLFAGLAVAEDGPGPEVIAALQERVAMLEERAREEDIPRFRLPELSLVVMGAAGASTASDEELAVLQGGGHDPHRRGFTFQGAELAIGGAIEPYCAVELHLVAIREEPSGGTGIELEEAFARSTSLPAGLEAKAGLYLLEFGRFNPVHTHEWQFIDQPVAMTRMFGGDGQRTPGARMLWEPQVPWHADLIVGVMDANGETAPSFQSDEETGAVAGRPFTATGTRSAADLLYNARWANSGDLDAVRAEAGLSAATGPNAAGERTSLVGADLATRWHPRGDTRGWPFVLVEAEVVARAYDAPATELVDGDGQPAGHVDATSLRDRGLVLQAVYGFVPGWGVGARWERCWGEGDSIATDADGGQTLIARNDDPMRDDRRRLSGLLTWQPVEALHFRLQYNHDRAGHLDDPEHSVWLGAEFLIGSHASHNH